MPLQLASQYRTHKVEGEFRKRELAPAIDLLQKAKIISTIQHSAGQGVPLAAQADPKLYKLIMLDVALSQSVLGIKMNDWLVNPHQQYVNKGSLVEAFVGQEMLAYSDPRRPAHLYYWQRKEKSSTAEVDYLFEKNQLVFPIEVKSDKGTSLKSVRMFLETHERSPYAVRFSTHDYSVFDQVHSYPLYAVAGFCAADLEVIKEIVSAH